MRAKVPGCPGTLAPGTLPYFPPGAAYPRRFEIDQAGASVPGSVCVRRTNLARAGGNVIDVRELSPLPSATGWLHVVPSVDVWTE